MSRPSPRERRRGRSRRPPAQAGAVDEDHDVVVVVVPKLERCVRLDHGHALRLELDPFGRLAEVHGQRSLEHGEDLLLRLVRVATAAAARR
jgi:hypothetical protein